MRSTDGGFFGGRIMKKIICFCFVITLLLLTLTGCSDNEATSDNTAASERISTNVSVENSINELSPSINEIRIGAHEADKMNETEIASFSTKLGGKDTPRSRNIGITTSTLNETVVKNGETFSFCKLIRKSYCRNGI